MRHLLAILIFVCSAQVGYAQIHFNRAYDNSVYINSTASVWPSSSGYSFVDATVITGGTYLRFLQLNAIGDTVFVKSTFVSENFISPSASHSFIKTIDSNFVFCGSVFDSTGHYDAFVAKFNPQGDTLWTRRFGGLLFDVANAVFEMPSGKLWVVFNTESYGNGGMDCGLVEFAQNGDSLRSFFYGTSLDEQALNGDVTLDSGFIISGMRNNFPYIVKVDSAGNQEWTDTYNTYGTDYCFITQHPAGGYVIATRKVASGSSQICLLRTTANGAVTWFQHYGTTADEYSYAKPIVLADGSIVLAGEFDPNDGSPYGGFVLKTNPFGVQQWFRYYWLSTVANDLYDIKTTPDGGFILSGSTFINTQDSWLVKIDSMGCEVAGCDPASIPETEFSEFNLYPNPNNGAFTIELNTATIADVYVYDAIGQLVSAEKVQPHVLHQMNLLNSGAYMITVVTAEGQRTSKRVIVTR